MSKKPRLLNAARGFAEVLSLNPLRRRTKRFRRTELDQVRSSRLFDEAWYLQRYRDLGLAELDPLVHYLEIGWRQGRDPGPDFSTTAYLKANPDVAASGINPLLHFIEFGSSEGRTISGHRGVAIRPAARERFPQPPPWQSFALAAKSAPKWMHSREIDRSAPGVLLAGDAVLGVASDEPGRQRVLEVVQDLGRLSGSDPNPVEARQPATGFGVRPEDSWFLNALDLRTRWSIERSPFLVRGFQCDPASGGSIRLVGEGLIAGSLAFVDFRLWNPFFPILFVTAAPEGEVQGARLLGFPSLCRGGLHYPELLHRFAGDASSAVDPFSAGDELAAALLKLTDSDLAPAVRAITVDILDADGSEPLFQPEFQTWLKTVMRVTVEPSARVSVGPAAAYLAQVVALHPEKPRLRGGSLMLQSQMTPTIAALTECLEGPIAGTRDQILALLIARAEATEPVTVVHLPRAAAGLNLNSRLAGHDWPLLSPGSQGEARQDFPPAAVQRRRSRPLADAELFIPVSDLADSGLSGSRPAIGWLMSGPDGDRSGFAQEIEAASLQMGSERDTLALVGKVDPATIRTAESFFPGRVHSFQDLTTTVRYLGTPLAAFLGNGIILHDNRTAALLSKILEIEAARTASCVLITGGKGGKAWHPAVAATGTLLAPDGSDVAAEDGNRAALELWRRTYPVALPPAKFWLARTAWLQRALEGSCPVADKQVMHLCTSLVTASDLMPGTAGVDAGAFLPRASDDWVTRVETLFG